MTTDQNVLTFENLQKTIQRKAVCYIYISEGFYFIKFVFSKVDNSL